MGSGFAENASAPGGRGRPPPSIPARPIGRAERLRSLRGAFAEAPSVIRVFAYGSLMWNPCFDAEACRPAVLEGHRRRFSIWSVRARGTPENPGLGLALEPEAGARCEGIVFTLAEGVCRDALEPLWEREMWAGTYRPAWLGVRAGGEETPALTFLADPGHRQYAGVLPPLETARRIAAASGALGTCRDYLAETVEALHASGLADDGLERLLAAVDRRRARSALANRSGEDVG